MIQPKITYWIFCRNGIAHVEKRYLLCFIIMLLIAFAMGLFYGKWVSRASFWQGIPLGWGLYYLAEEVDRLRIKEDQAQSGGYLNSDENKFQLASSQTSTSGIPSSSLEKMVVEASEADVLYPLPLRTVQALSGTFIILITNKTG